MLLRTTSVWSMMMLFLNLILGGFLLFLVGLFRLLIGPLTRLSGGCLSIMFIDLFVELSIPRQSAIKVVAAIHNNFIQKLRKRIWNLRTYDKNKWKDVMNITLKLKTTPRPSHLPVTLYVPFSSLPPLTHLMTSHDSRTDWIKNSMIQGLSWYNYFVGFNGSSNSAT
ncbi:hypothetical protein RclHR1_11300001 [Rhizophagus clarus]|uniref:Uncharacterized protein n=1 Tax=Rhizophagus clarus TaxID=94130 RepID=A0A2Z6Q8G3_9GLOM|nr:hypothetical protein RclHR1_11300001 [Rhizophagus clarus]GES82278.1 hypothetical protein GLOIN_2v1785553 [Rhizophagus clarus]